MTSKSGRFRKTLIALILLVFLGQLFESGNITLAASNSGIKSATKKVKVGNKNFTVQTVQIPKGTPVTVGLAKGQVGSTEKFEGIISRYKGEAAINGAFFEAYGGPPDPYGTLIAGGRFMHNGGYGTVIGYLADGTALMDTLRTSIKGKVKKPDGKTLGWYVTFLNREPAKGSNVSIMYTPDRGTKVGFSGGIAVTIVEGKVTKNENNNNASIPANGYVIVFSGTEQSSAERFVIDSEVERTFTYKDALGNLIPWEEVIAAVGAGPRLVKDGKVSLDAANEGFKDPKILTGSAARSGIAIMPDGSTLLATVSGATMKQWAEIMKSLGAKQAMNLDGGASSALYGGGKVLTPAGRLLSNTLIFGAQVSK
ncbi:phosphodiester glycosidase family protein [Paenibacillus anaericanus]|uniref:phosphodiester glycosidase family protein n=1 Tax=Paenibacillus anaericanus TaxID=170367 RepID=UPI001FE498B5|nr:phosphodiester glycosidase family protein [Paenibacillus anaericanus]